MLSTISLVVIGDDVLYVQESILVGLYFLAQVSDARCLRILEACLTLRTWL